jgi:hypothetical protein
MQRFLRLNSTRNYPQWRAVKVTDWMLHTRWVAMNDQTGLVRYPCKPGKDEARALARQLSYEEKKSYKRFLIEGCD